MEAFFLRSNFTSRLKLKLLVRSIRKLSERKEAQKLSRLVALATIQLSRTLSVIFELLYEEKQFDLAQLAAFWSLEMILKHERKFRDVARSFSNVVKIIYRTSSVHSFLWLQKVALEEVTRTLFIDEMNLEGLTALIELYQGLMLCQ